MEIHEIRTEIKKMSERITQFRESLNVDKKELEIKEYDAKMQAAGFWDDQRKAQEVINAANALKDKVNTFYSLENEVEELSVAFELILEEADEDLQAELESQIQEVSEKLNKFELEILLGLGCGHCYVGGGIDENTVVNSNTDLYEILNLDCLEFFFFIIVITF